MNKKLQILKSVAEELKVAVKENNSHKRLVALKKLCGFANVAIISGATGRRLAKRLFNKYNYDFYLFYKNFEDTAKSSIYHLLYAVDSSTDWEGILNSILNSVDDYIVPSKELAGAFIYNNAQGSFFNDINKEDKNPLKLSKILRYVFNIQEEKEIKKLVELWQSYYNSSLLKDEVKIIEDLYELYNMPHATAGSLGGSCMRGRGEYYYNLQDLGIKALHIVENGELKGRALVWSCEDVNNQKKHTLLDRVYYASKKYKDAIIGKFLELYPNNSIIRVEESYSANETFNIIEDGRIKETKKMQLLVDTSEVYLLGDSVPYMDTFKFYNSNENYLTNIDDGEATHRLTNTNGEAEVIKGIECACCGAEMDENETYYSEYLGIYLCDSCAVWSDIMTDYISTDEAIPIIGSGGEIYDYIIDDEEYLNSRGFTKIIRNGKIYAVSYDDIIYFEYLNEDYLLSELIRVEVVIDDIVEYINTPLEYQDDEEVIINLIEEQLSYNTDDYKILGFNDNNEFILKSIEEEEDDE